MLILLLRDLMTASIQSAATAHPPLVLTIPL